MLLVDIKVVSRSARAIEHDLVLSGGTSAGVISGHWFPVSGSTFTNQVSLPMDTAPGTIFYHLNAP